MKVELLDKMGTDLSVVNAARVSFDKESEWDKGFSGEKNSSRVFSLSDADASNCTCSSTAALMLEWSPIPAGLSI